MISATFALCRDLPTYTSGNCQSETFPKQMASHRQLMMCLLLVMCMLLATALAQTEDVKSLQEAINRFSSKLYKEQSQDTGNLLFSPLCIHSVLTMLSFGARAATAEQMTHSLSLPSHEVTSQGYKSLREQIAAETKVIILMANKIYSNKDLKVLPEFLDHSKEVFASGIQALDFSSTSAADTINKWVDENTNHKISSIINQGSLSSATATVLVSAIYFKGKWEHNFTNVEQKSFVLNAKYSVDIPTMTLKATLRYKETSKYRLVELPYTGDTASMIVILPKKRFDLKSVEEEITGNGLAAFVHTNNLKKIPVDVHLPKFRLEIKKEMKQPLMKMGMPAMFSNAADFSGMMEQDTQVSQVLHKAYIDVTPEGTEAAAATSVGISLKMGLMQPESINFHVDEPFLFLLHHPLSGHVMFMGRCLDPRHY